MCVQFTPPQPFPAPLQIGPTSLRIATVPVRRESSAARRWRAMNPLTARSHYFRVLGMTKADGRKTSDGPVRIVGSDGPPPLSGKMVKSTNLMRCWPSGWVPDFQSGQTGSTPVRRSICAIDILACVPDSQSEERSSILLSRSDTGVVQW